MSRFIEKSKKVLTVLLIAAIAFVTTTSNTKAVADSIAVGDSQRLDAYIGGARFSTKTTTDGKMLYCLDMPKNTTRNTTVRKAGEKNAGYAYIILNGYPNKSFTGDTLKDYYITQTAIWWYQDETEGTTNLGESFKSTGQDKHNMRHFVKELVDGAINAKNQGYTKISVSASVENNGLTLDGDYYVSKEIKVSTNANDYTVQLSGATENTKVVSASGKEGTTIPANEGFIIKVPTSEVNSTELSIKATITANGVVYKAYEYVPDNDKMQKVTPGIVEPTEEKVQTSIDLGLITTKVTITKYDSATNNPLPGAKLVLKDASGEVITSWTSTNNSHVIRNLVNGTYTVTEEEAPTGYKLSDEKVSFTISEEATDVEVKFYNTAKEKTVVNITKIDSETGNALPGATLVIKDAKGKEVDKFTTTEEAHVITDLAYGTYTVSEVSAPAGYAKSDEVLTFTLDDENTSYQIKFANYKEFTVPNTSTNTLLYTLIGIVIIGSGLGFVYKNAKKEK